MSPWANVPRRLFWQISNLSIPIDARPDSIGICQTALSRVFGHGGISGEKRLELEPRGKSPLELQTLRTFCHRRIHSGVFESH